MAPLSEKNMEITTNMHCQDLEKMRYLVFVTFLSWSSWAHSETGFGLSTSKIPILGMSKMPGKQCFFHILRPSRHPYFLREAQVGPTWALLTSQRKSIRGQWHQWVKKSKKITMKMHCQDFEKMHSLFVLVKKTQKTNAFFTFWCLEATHTFWWRLKRAQLGPLGGCGWLFSLALGAWGNEIVLDANL